MAVNIKDKQVHITKKIQNIHGRIQKYLWLSDLWKNANNKTNVLKLKSKYQHNESNSTKCVVFVCFLSSVVR